MTAWRVTNTGINAENMFTSDCLYENLVPINYKISVNYTKNLNR